MRTDPDSLTWLEREASALQIHVDDARTRCRDADVENRSGELHVRLMLAHGQDGRVNQPGQPDESSEPPPCSRAYSAILRYSVPRLMSSTRAASFLFHWTASSTREMCARSASASDGRRSGPEGCSTEWVCRNSTSCARIARPGAERAARDTVLSSSRMLPGHEYVMNASSASRVNILLSSGSPCAAQ